MKESVKDDCDKTNKLEAKVEMTPIYKDLPQHKQNTKQEEQKLSQIYR